MVMSHTYKEFHRIILILVLASVSSLILFINGDNIGLSTSPQAEDSEFLNNFYSLVNDTNQVSQNYDDEIGKWKKGEYDNQQIVSITNSYLPQYDQLIAYASNFSAPEKFQWALDLYIKSLNSERQSNELFRDYIETGNPDLNETATDLLSNASKYEFESFALINAQNDALKPIG
jgi:hypothetical protein